MHLCLCGEVSLTTHAILVSVKNRFYICQSFSVYSESAYNTHKGSYVVYLLLDIVFTKLTFIR